MKLTRREVLAVSLGATVAPDVPGQWVHNERGSSAFPELPAEPWPKQYHLVDCHARLSPSSPAELVRSIERTFLEGEASVACLLPTWRGGGLAALRATVTVAALGMELNRHAYSRRAILAGGLVPELGSEGIEAIHHQAERLRVDLWLWDAGRPYEAEESREAAFAAVRRTGIHRVVAQLPLGADGASDVFNTIRAHPSFGFLIVPLVTGRGRLPEWRQWMRDLCHAAGEAPPPNVWVEVGTAFLAQVRQSPREAAAGLVSLGRAFGIDQLVWGTGGQRLPRSAPALLRSYGGMAETDCESVLSRSAHRALGIAPTEVQCPWDPYAFMQLAHVLGSWSREHLTTGTVMLPFTR